MSLCFSAYSEAESIILNQVCCLILNICCLHALYSTGIGENLVILLIYDILVPKLSLTMSSNHTLQARMENLHRKATIFLENKHKI